MNRQRLVVLLLAVCTLLGSHVVAFGQSFAVPPPEPMAYTVLTQLEKKAASVLQVPDAGQDDDPARWVIPTVVVLVVLAVLVGLAVFTVSLIKGHVNRRRSRERLFIDERDFGDGYTDSDSDDIWDLDDMYGMGSSSFDTSDFDR